jgi:peroxiredoxin
LNNFFTNVVIQHPDSICKEADKLVEKARANKEMFKYVVWWITYNYETSKVIGFDAIFVHMVEAYYMTNQCYWMTPTLLENITKRAMKLKPILLGKTAPNMIMQDTNFQLQSLAAVVAKYTIVLFWDYNCGHCKTEMPKIVKFYNTKKDELGLKVFAVCTDTSMVEMKKFIRKDSMNFINVDGPRAITPHYAELYDIYSTPVIYLLDEKKTIISKRIEVDMIGDIINHDIKMKELEKKQ